MKKPRLHGPPKRSCTRCRRTNFEKCWVIWVAEYLLTFILRWLLIVTVYEFDALRKNVDHTPQSPLGFPDLCGTICVHRDHGIYPWHLGTGFVPLCLHLFDLLDLGCLVLSYQHTISVSFCWFSVQFFVTRLRRLHSFPSSCPRPLNHTPWASGRVLGVFGSRAATDLPQPDESHRMPQVRRGIAWYGLKRSVETWWNSYHVWLVHVLW